MIMIDDKVLNPPIVVDLTKNLDFQGHKVLREISAEQKPTGDWLVRIKPFVNEDGFGFDYIRGRTSSKIIAGQTIERLVNVRIECPGTGKYFRKLVIYLPKNSGDIPDWLLNSEFGTMVKIWRIVEQQKLSLETIRRRMNWNEQQLRDSIAAGTYNNLIMESAKQMLLNLITESQKGGSTSKKVFGGDKEKE